MKTKQLLACLLLLGLTQAVFAQKEEADEPSATLPEEQGNGYVITAKGDTLHGTISIWKKEPWWNEKKVKIVLADRKKEKFKPGEATGYMVDGIAYKVIGYSDKSAISFAMIKNDYFMEVLADGRIKAYRFYEIGPSVFFGGDEAYEKETQRIRDEWHLLVQKDDGKLHRVDNVKDFEKLIGDDKEVWGKFQSGAYGGFETKDKKGLGKFIRNRINAQLQLPWVNAIKDYNAKQATSVADSK